jgi:hypothetical protein
VLVHIELSTNQRDRLRAGIDDAITPGQERCQLDGFAARRIRHFMFAALRKQDGFTGL